MPVSDVYRGIFKRGVKHHLMIYVGGYFLILVVGPVVIVAFDPPVAAVAGSIGALISLAALVLATRSGLQARAEMKQLMRDRDQPPDRG